MSERVNIGNLGAAIERELTMYSENVAKAINEKGAEAVEKLVELTKATAPVGYRGKFKKAIASKELDSGFATKKYVWYVKAPHHRLTHLLVHGHATVNGGRTRADPFLRNALNTVLPEYEKSVEEVLKNGK